MRGLLILMLLPLFIACGSVRVYDLPKVQQSLQGTLQKSETIAQKALNDFSEKKMLIDNLAKSDSPVFRENENEIRTRLRAMDTALQDIVVEKKKMVEANSEIASLSYNRPNVRSDEREYGRVDDAVKRFEDAAKGMNSSVVDYSRESNSMADLIEQKKLYFNFDVAEFQKRVQRNVTVAQDNQKVMERELKRSQNVLASARTENKSRQEAVYAEMLNVADEYSKRANRFAEINREVNSSVMGAARISTLDPHWGEVQKLVAEFERLVGELTDINEKFLSKVDAFRNPVRRVR